MPSQEHCNHPVGEKKKKKFFLRYPLNSILILNFCEEEKFIISPYQYSSKLYTPLRSPSASSDPRKTKPALLWNHKTRKNADLWVPDRVNSIFQDLTRNILHFKCSSRYFLNAASDTAFTTLSGSSFQLLTTPSENGPLQSPDPLQISCPKFVLSNFIYLYNVNTNHGHPITKQTSTITCPLLLSRFWIQFALDTMAAISKILSHRHSLHLTGYILQDSVILLTSLD